ncbi:hypothetical protein IscW_ISCW006825 [Ixodes scapularis]|uniref:Uncharacterized protein n=1 Tax=Ixodes scapularis TaxID=6945 RepID=B7PL22_IXOSC|nr:hypothetical protein IscW_ISCW006825 [Ixodes scapularis]|eukprot:XP_002434470.1 hypothetical protein IscW_ISCW006825 [Ixodes scapularis]
MLLGKTKCQELQSAWPDDHTQLAEVFRSAHCTHVGVKSELERGEGKHCPVTWALASSAAQRALLDV